VIHIYQTPQGKNRTICEAFAAGCGGKIVGPYPLQPEGDAFMFGVLRGTLPTLRAAQREGRTYYYCDNGYFKPGRRIGDNGYYRVTRNALQHDGTGTASPERWQKLGMSIKPWRSSGSHIVVCPSSRLYAVTMRIDADEWLKNTLKQLTKATDRPVRVRKKMSMEEVKRQGGPSLADDLADCWALVTHSGNAAVEALLAGVPVFCAAPCAAYRMSLSDFAKIEEPAMPDDREQWAANLAAAQWNLDEMRSGLCWRELQFRQSTDGCSENGEGQ
jgi:hypothetical protein